MYHPVDAPEGRIFREDPGELPVGWVDAPGKLEQALEDIRAAGGVVAPVVAKKEAPAVAPLPENFDDVDSFMEAYTAASIDIPKEEGRLRDAALKAGLEQYLMAKYKAAIDRRQSVETIRLQAVTLDEGK